MPTHRGIASMSLEGFTDVSVSLRGGVYALCAKGKVIYIGKSKSMLSRIVSHKNAWTDKRKGKESWITNSLGIPGLFFDEVHVRYCHPDAIDALEAEMINLYKPRYNIQLKTTQKAALPAVLTINGVVLSLAQPKPKPEFIRRA